MNDDNLRPFVRYLWWLTPEEAISNPRRLIAQVMDMGDYRDVERMRKTLGDEVLRDVIHHAEPGWFRPKSWHSWHYRLYMAELNEVPPLPKRRFE